MHWKISKVLLLCLVSTGAAGSTIYCNPYPTTVAQPTSFRTAYDGSITFTASPAVTNPTDLSVSCKIDVPVLGPGTHTAAVKACIDTTNCSVTTSVTFASLVGGTPAAPTGLRVEP